MMDRLLLLNKVPTTGRVPKPGTPLLSRELVSFIKPPMATMLVFETLTMVSLSLIVLDASGSRKLPEVPRSMSLVFSITLDTDGWICRMIWLCSSICGVTSSATPEKNGATVMVGDCVLVVPVVVVFVVMLVTKKSSVPTFSTAFWLFSVAIRGLDSTCRSPWVSRKEINAAKLLVWNARPNNVPGVPAKVAIVPGAPGVDAIRELAATVPSGFLAVKALTCPLGVKIVPGPITPPATRLFGPWPNAAQLTPVLCVSES